MKVKQIMVQDVITISPDATVVSAAQRMRKWKIGTLLVVQRKEIKGIITERDIINKVVAEQLCAHDIKVKEIMTKTLITADVNIDDVKAASIMKTYGIKKLPLVDKHGHVVGIITETDLLKALGERWAT